MYLFMDDSVFRETLSYTEEAGSMSMSMSMPAKYFVTASTVPGTRSSSPSSLTTRTPNATVIVLAPTAPSNSNTNTQAQAQKKVNAMTNNIKSPGGINSDNDNEMQSKASTFGGGGLSGGAIGGIAVAMVAVVAVAAAAVIKKRTSPSS